jgi:hypothetical protein
VIYSLLFGSQWLFGSSFGFLFDWLWDLVLLHWELLKEFTLNIFELGF